jgi:uncharacterized protein YfiM (DUF2279 family)
MKQIKHKFLFLIMSLLSSEAFAANTPDVFSFSRMDHQLHFVTSYALSLSGTTYLMKRGMPQKKALLISSLTVFAIGMGKEFLYDNRYEKGDIVANSLGILTQSIFVIHF